MIARCTRPTAINFPDYGGRGISVCDQWRDFANFFADMGDRPTPKHEIERRNNAGNYCPENCYWATRAQQAVNKRNSILLTIQGETKCLADWARQSTYTYSGIYYRLKRGKARMSHEEAVFGVDGSSRGGAACLTVTSEASA